MKTPRELNRLAALAGVLAVSVATQVALAQETYFDKLANLDT
jgi:hypothetical protein